MYSIAWSTVKQTPRKIVRPRPWTAPVLSPPIILWCAQVTVAPEDSSNPVLSSGTWTGQRASIPEGGQTHPRLGEIAQVLWNKAQNKERKKKTSETINRSIPHRWALTTSEVWWPIKLLSRITSRHHWIIVRIISNRPRRRRVGGFWLNHLTRPMAVDKAPMEPVKGHGLISTRW